MNNITLDAMLAPTVSSNESLTIFIPKKISLILVICLSMLYSQNTLAQEKNLYDAQNLKLEEAAAEGIIFFQEIISRPAEIQNFIDHVYTERVVSNE
ncbi:MAG: hypothetical protein AB8B65_19735 [Kordia sp.]|uniref:hypothetical protein n=1 Tax=Kordia sp. TaxID=1965332 RepID=UPI0038593CC2